MPNGTSRDLCDLCKTGRVATSSQKMSFHQWTSRGMVSCTVTIPIGICESCGARGWDEAAEAVIEDAVRRELDKLEHTS
jgi:hypothetical protein